MKHLMFVAAMVASLTACEKKKSTSALPEAKDWSAQTPGDKPPVAANAPAGELPPGHPPLDQGSDPHAGMAPGAALTPPNPATPADPNRMVSGVISVDKTMASKLKVGGTIFLVAKAKGANGEPTGAALAVEKLTYQGSELPFQLSDAQAMSAGTQLTGDIVITAWYDQDDDAISKQPGDVQGQLAVKVPAKGLAVVLSKLL